MDFMLVCLPVCLISVHRPHTRARARVCAQRGKMDAFVASEVMMRDGSWHVSGA